MKQSIALARASAYLNSKFVERLLCCCYVCCTAFSLCCMRACRELCSLKEAVASLSDEGSGRAVVACGSCLCNDWECLWLVAVLVVTMCGIRAAARWVSPVQRSSLYPSDRLSGQALGFFHLEGGSLEIGSYLNLCSHDIALQMVSSWFSSELKL